MSRRRAAREQEKQEFLEQNPHLIVTPPEPDTHTTRIEVEEVTIPYSSGGSDMPTIDTFEPVFSVDDSPAVPFGFGEFFQEENLGIAFGIAGPHFAMIGTDTTQVNSDDIEDVLIQISLTDRGFGVVSEEEFEAFIAAVNDDEFEDLSDIPGVNSISSGEVLGLRVFSFNEFDIDTLPQGGAPDIGIPGKGVPLQLDPPENEPQIMEEEEDGGVSLGLDFTASGTGSVSVTLFEDTDDAIGFTQTFDVPNGTDPDAVLTALFEQPADDIFEFVAITTTGSLEISVVGIDLETSFDPNAFFLE